MHNLYELYLFFATSMCYGVEFKNDNIIEKRTKPIIQQSDKNVQTQKNNALGQEHALSKKEQTKYQSFFKSKL